MTTLKAKDIQKMTSKEREDKLKELKIELIKSKAGASKTGGGRIKEIKKIIARILTINNSNKEVLKDK
jgi:ribosomal protein L29